MNTLYTILAIIGSLVGAIVGAFISKDATLKAVRHQNFLIAGETFRKDRISKFNVARQTLLHPNKYEQPDFPRLDYSSSGDRAKEKMIRKLILNRIYNVLEFTKF